MVAQEAEERTFDLSPANMSSRQSLPLSSIPASPSPNIPPHDATTAPVNRRARRLPQVDSLRRASVGFSGGGMRRAQSLGFLAGDCDENRPRRRLPDPAQGKLIRHVETKLQEEARLRLEVVKELKEEKQMRWKAEDELVAARGRIKQLQDLCQEKRSQLQEVMADAEEERKQRQDLETQLQRATKEASIARRDLAKEQEASASQGQEIRDFEATVQDALQSSWEEKRLRQEAEERLNALVGLLRDQAAGCPDASDKLVGLLQMLQGTE